MYKYMYRYLVAKLNILAVTAIGGSHSHRFTLLEYSGLLMWLMLTIYLNRGPDKLSYSFETMVQRFFHYIGKKSSNSKPIAHSHLTFTRYKTFPFFHLHSPTEPRVKFLKNFFLFLTILACEPTCLHTQQK